MRTQTALTYSDIQDGIAEYIRATNYYYALFLTGNWGVGKTFFVKNSIKKSLPDNFQSIYISLFGISTLEELDTRISTELMLKLVDRRISIETIDKSALGKTLSIIGKTGYNVLLKKFMVAQEDLPGIKDLLGIVSTIKKLPKILFVFDDLERTSCDMKNLLGYFNNFIESYKAKVLLVGNTEKIGVIAQEETSTTVNFEDNNIKPKNTSKQSSELDLFTLYKEKIVGFTIIFQPDFHTVAKTLINSLRDSPHYDKQICDIDNLCDGIIELFDRKGIYNLRTLEAIIFTIDRLNTAFKNKNLQGKFFLIEDKQDFFYDAALQIAYYKLSVDFPSMAITIPSMTMSQKQFSFIENIVVSSLIPWDLLYRDADNYIIQKKWDRENRNDPLSILIKHNVYLENEQFLSHLLDAATKILTEKKYTPPKWAEFILLVFILEEEGLITTIKKNEIVEEIKAQVRNEDWTKKELDGFLFSEKFSYYSLTQDKNQELKKIAHELETERMISLNRLLIEKLNHYFINKNWEKIKELNEEINLITYRTESFLVLLENEELDSFVLDMSSNDYKGFYEMCSRVYRYRNTLKEEEITRIQQLISLLNDATPLPDKLLQCHRIRLSKYFTGLVDKFK